MGESHMLMLITALDSIVKPNVHSDIFSIEHLVYVKKKLQLYESLKNRIYEERSEAKEIMVALDSIFLNIQELLFKISNQNPDMGNINLLIKYQIIEVKFKILKLCVAFSALNTSDPSGEWQLIVDFDDTTFDANKLFSSALRDLISCVKSFNTFCNDHLIMRPCVKKIKMLINSIPEIPYTEISNENFFEISNKVAASSTPLDENYKSFQLQLEDVVLNILQHSFLREGIIRMRQLELKMHQRVLGLMRYQHLHIAGESLLSDVNIQNYEVFKRLHSTLDLLANREALISQAETKLQCLRDNMESSNQNDAIKSLSVVVDQGIQVLNGEKEEVKKFLQICNSINHFESTRLLKSWAKILYNDFYTEVEKFKKHKVIKKLKNNPIISELFEYFKVKKDSFLEAIDAIELMFVKINLFIDHLGKLSKHLSKKDSSEIQEKLKLFTIIQNMKYMVLKLIPSTKVAFEALSNSSEKDPNCITLLLSCKFSHLEALSNKIRTTVHYILNAFKKGSLHDLTEENSLDFSDEQDYNFEDIFIKKNFLSEESDVGMEKNSNFEKEADILSDPQNSENSSVDQKEVRNSQAHERNVYASNMLKTVRSKLEGDVGRLNITDQVSLVINQATSVDNLSMMYEGWMAWI
ncbi:Serine/threonine-protein kinase smg1 [Lobulomyces angularis]|nr:Serine/threonine-protein kinase smg1 [Lobulomyces angularis]